MLAEQHIIYTLIYACTLCYSNGLNSSRPSDAIWCCRTVCGLFDAKNKWWSYLIRANTWTNDGVLPLNAWKQMSVKLKSNCNYPYSKKCNWKYRLKDIGHFVQTSVFQLSIVKYCPDGECDHLKTFYTVHAYPGSCSFICCAVNWWYDKTCQWKDRYLMH